MCKTIPRQKCEKLKVAAKPCRAKVGKTIRCCFEVKTNLSVGAWVKVRHFLVLLPKTASKVLFVAVKLAK